MRSPQDMGFIYGMSDVCEYKGNYLNYEFIKDSSLNKDSIFINVINGETKKIIKRKLILNDSVYNYIFRDDAGQIVFSKDTIACVFQCYCQNHPENANMLNTSKLYTYSLALDTNFNIISNLKIIDSTGLNDSFRHITLSQTKLCVDKIIYLSLHYERTGFQFSKARLKYAVLNRRSDILKTGVFDPDGWGKVADSLKNIYLVGGFNFCTSPNKGIGAITVNSVFATGQITDPQNFYSSKFYTYYVNSELEVIKKRGTVINFNLDSNLTAAHIPIMAFDNDSNLYYKALYSSKAYLGKIYFDSTKLSKKIALHGFSGVFSNDADLMLGQVVFNSNSNTIFRVSHVRGSNGIVRCYTPSTGWINNYWHVFAYDTALNLKWNKYVMAEYDSCFDARNITASTNYNGIYVNGIKMLLGADTNIKGGLAHQLIWYVDSTLSPNEISPIVIRDRFNIYPNPAQNNLYIDDVENVLPYYIYITDNLGKLILKKEAIGSTDLNISALASATYFAIIKYEDNKIFRSKFIKN